MGVTGIRACLLAPLLPLIPPAMLSSSPHTRIYHLPHGQDGAGLVVADAEDEQAIGFCSWEQEINASPGPRHLRTERWCQRE